MKGKHLRIQLVNTIYVDLSQILYHMYNSVHHILDLSH